jgi:hypothetical protein
VLLSFLHPHTEFPILLGLLSVGPPIILISPVGLVIQIHRCCFTLASSPGTFSSSNTQCVCLELTAATPQSPRLTSFIFFLWQPSLDVTTPNLLHSCLLRPPRLRPQCLSWKLTASFMFFATPISGLPIVQLRSGHASVLRTMPVNMLTTFFCVSIFGQRLSSIRGRLAPLPYPFWTQLHPLRRPKKSWLPSL